MGVEPGKQGIDGLGPDQSLTKSPDRRLIRRVVALVEAEEPPEAAPIQDMELGLRVRQAVERLQHQGLEHHDRVHRRPATLAAVRALQRRIQRRPEYLEVDQGAELLQRIARRRQGRIPPIEIEKTTLYNHIRLHRHTAMES